MRCRRWADMPASSGFAAGCAAATSGHAAIMRARLLSENISGTSVHIIRMRAGMGVRLRETRPQAGVGKLKHAPPRPRVVNISGRDRMNTVTAVPTSAAPFQPESAPDYLPAPILRELQLGRLRSIVERAWANVPLHRSRMKQSGLEPADVHSLDDIAALPFTTKADLRDTYPFGLFASPMEEIVRLHASSGTTGKPIVVAYTRQDVDVWTSVMVRSFATCGLHAGDIVQNAYGYGLFTGGLGAHYGAEGLGATVIPISGGNTDRQIMVMRDFGVTAICSTPSYFLHLIERATQLGVDIRALPLRAGVFGAEPWTASMRKRIESLAGIQAFDIYGLSEVIGPGVAVECPHQDGLHIFEDHFYPEIVDPETGHVLPEGEEGELVLTTLSKLAMPMIRYRTRDITALMPDHRHRQLAE